MGLSISQAMALTGRSRATLYRWRADGCDITSENSLRQYSDFADMNARGRSAQLAFDRSPIKASRSPLYASDAATAVLTLLEAFKRRLAIATDEERGMLSEEVKYLAEAHRLVEMVAEGYC